MIKSVFIKLLIFTVVLELMAVAIMFLLPLQYISPTLLFQVVFFFATSFLVYYYLLHPSNQQPNKFIRAFMITTFLRFLLYVVMVAIYVFLFRHDAVNFLLTFFAFFVCYLIFDVYVLLFGMKKTNNK